MADVSTTVLTLKMASAQVVETSVINNSPSQDSITQMIFFNQGNLNVNDLRS